jgi:hypothetical protein
LVVKSFSWWLTSIMVLTSAILGLFNLVVDILYQAHLLTAVSGFHPLGSVNSRKD